MKSRFHPKKEDVNNLGVIKLKINLKKLNAL